LEQHLNLNLASDRIIAESTPEQVAVNKASHTEKYLKPVLNVGR